MPGKKAHWRQRHFSLPKNHQWQAQPGNLVFVIDRGKAILEIPNDWHIIPNLAGSVRILDHPEPDTRMGLEISILYVPLVDWSGLPLTKLIEDCYIAGYKNEIIARRPFRQWSRPDDRTEAAWLETDMHDEPEDRTSTHRLCLARSIEVYCLITLDFWPEDHQRADQIWNSVMETLKLGGPLLKPDGAPIFYPQRISPN